MMEFSRADRRDDAFADARNDRFFGRAADSRSRFVRTVTFALTESWMPFIATASIVWRPFAGWDNRSLRIDGCIHRVANIAAARSIAQARSKESAIEALVRGDQRLDHRDHVAARQRVRFDTVG